MRCVGQTTWPSKVANTIKTQTAKSGFLKSRWALSSRSATTFTLSPVVEVGYSSAPRKKLSKFSRYGAAIICQMPRVAHVSCWNRLLARAEGLFQRPSGVEEALTCRDRGGVSMTKPCNRLATRSLPLASAPTACWPLRLALEKSCETLAMH